MTVLEKIIHDVQGLSSREQVEVASYVHRLSKKAQQERTEMLQRTHGALDEVDGEAFEQAMNDARRIDPRG